MKPTIFLTGGTGLIGSYLLKIFLQAGHEVYVLVRKQGQQNCLSRITNCLNFWDKNILEEHRRSLTVLEGDISSKQLGLGSQDYFLLRKSVEEIYHCAAITAVNVPLVEIRKPNVEGTRNVLVMGKDFLKNGRLKKMNYISTAYVCGDYQGRFGETDLEMGQNFNSTYTQSKFEAEKLIHAFREQNDLWVDIYRPVLVAGELKTGKTFQLKHIYQFLHICSMNIFDSLPLHGASVNLAPVDVTSKAIYVLASNSVRKNATYHPFSLDATRFDKVLFMARVILGITVPKLLTQQEFATKELSPIQRKILNNNVFAINQNLTLDCDWTNEFLQRLGFKFPNFEEEALEVLLRYLKKNDIAGGYICERN